MKLILDIDNIDNCEGICDVSRCIAKTLINYKRPDEIIYYTALEQLEILYGSCCCAINGEVIKISMYDYTIVVHYYQYATYEPSKMVSDLDQLLKTCG